MRIGRFLPILAAGAIGLIGSAHLRAQGATVTVWGTSSPIGTVSTYSASDNIPGGTAGGGAANDADASGTDNMDGGGGILTFWSPWFYDAVASVRSGWKWMDKWNDAGSIDLDKLDPKITQTPSGKLTIRAKQTFEVVASLGFQTEIANAAIGSKAAWEAEHSAEIQGSASYTCDIKYILCYQVKGMSQRFLRAEFSQVGLFPVLTGQSEEFWGWAEASDATKVRVSNETKNCIP